MSLLIRNGKIVTPEGITPADVLVVNGKIAGIEKGIVSDGTETLIDAEGRYLLPGGIDPHVHMHLPGQAGFSSDDFLSGSRAALHGGTTCMIDFVTPARGSSLVTALADRKREASASLVDHSFHVSPVEWRDSTEDEIKECIDAGVRSFKVYMAYKDTVGIDDITLFKVMNAASKYGGMVSVHCEDGDETDRRRNDFYMGGHLQPIYHALSRPPEIEALAVAKAIETAERASCTLYIVHVSAEESLKHIRKAKSSGQQVFAETCPQYLLLDENKYSGDFSQTAPFVMSPPLRSQRDCQALWEAIADGTVDTVGTDHCPFTMAQKSKGVADFRLIPGGTGGIEHRIELLYTYGVKTGRITLPRMTELYAAEPAKIFRLDNKGTLSRGSDADIVIWNPDTERTISASNHKQNCDINIYEGLQAEGSAEYVIVKGVVAVEQGRLNEKSLQGAFIMAGR